MLLAGGAVEPFWTRCHGVFCAVMVIDGYIIYADSFHVTGQAEALSTDEKATEGMDTCEKDDGFEYLSGSHHITSHIVQFRFFVQIYDKCFHVMMVHNYNYFYMTLM